MQSLITPEVMKYVKKRSEAMLGQYQFTKEDVEDIENEIYEELLRKANARYDESLSYMAFVNKVSTLKIREIIRKRKSKRRDYRKCQQYLSDPVTDSDGSAYELGETMSHDQNKIDTGHSNYDFQTLQDVNLDIKQAIESLPSEELKEIANLLLSYPKTEVRERLGLDRHALNYRVKQIQKHFINSGISKLS